MGKTKCEIIKIDMSGFADVCNCGFSHLWIEELWTFQILRNRLHNWKASVQFMLLRKLVGWLAVWLAACWLAGWLLAGWLAFEVFWFFEFRLEFLFFVKFVHVFWSPKDHIKWPVVISCFVAEKKALPGNRDSAHRALDGFGTFNRWINKPKMLIISW